MTPYEKDYELDKLFWFYDEMGGGVEGKRNKVLGAAPKAGRHYRPCYVTTGVTTSHTHTHTHFTHTLHTHTSHTHIFIAFVCICTH